MSLIIIWYKRKRFLNKADSLLLVHETYLIEGSRNKVFPSLYPRQAPNTSRPSANTLN